MARVLANDPDAVMWVGGHAINTKQSLASTAAIELGHVFLAGGLSSRVLPQRQFE